ncbi:MAG: hypothetical protein ACTS3T_21250 [Almyronema sp.]
MFKTRRDRSGINSPESPANGMKFNQTEKSFPQVTVSKGAETSASQRFSGIQPTFATLIALTLLTAALLAPFAFSSVYLAALREQSFDLHRFLRGDLYKQMTGYGALAFVLGEGMLTARKRSRSWMFKLKIPGSMQLWRSLHIFLGVGLVGMVLVHTLGSKGLNFNSVFLWVFFGVTLSALMGVVAETGILASSRKYFGRLPFRMGGNAAGTPMTKGPLVRGLRAIWLTTHIFLVGVFATMLCFHIFLAYYFQ